MPLYLCTEQLVLKRADRQGTSPAASGGGCAGPPMSTMVLSTTNSPPPPGLSQLSIITSYACWVNTQLRNSIACEHILYLKAYRHALEVLPYHGQAGGTSGKEPTCKCGLDPSVRNPLEEGIATGFNILCPENPTDRGAWRATVDEVARSQIHLSNLACTHNLHTEAKSKCARRSPAGPSKDTVVVIIHCKHLYTPDPLLRKFSQI